MRNKYYFKQENRELFEAMWQWILDHSDLESSGVLFLKAHIKSKEGFYQSIRYRMKGYARSIFDEQIMEKRKLEHYNVSTQQMNEALKQVEIKNRKILESKRKLWISFLGIKIPLFYKVKNRQV